MADPWKIFTERLLDWRSEMPWGCSEEDIMLHVIRCARDAQAASEGIWDEPHGAPVVLVDGAYFVWDRKKQEWWETDWVGTETEAALIDTQGEDR